MLGIFVLSSVLVFAMMSSIAFGAADIRLPNLLGAVFDFNEEDASGKPYNKRRC